MSLKNFQLVIIFLLSSLIINHYSLITSPALAGHCPGTNYDCQIKEIQVEIDALRPAQEKNQKELSSLRKQFDDIKKRVAGLSAKLKELEASIAKREEDLGVQKKLLGIRVHSLYRRSRQFSPLVTFLTSKSASLFTRELALREQMASGDRVIIEDLGLVLTRLAEDKKTLEGSRRSLQVLQKNVDGRATFLAGEVEKAGAYLSKLTSRQSELLALKAGGFAASVGDTPPTLEPCSGPPGTSNFCSPGFSPAFAVFSFGAPHRKGMSQFGALGRSKAGQSYKQILESYYGDVEVRKVSVPAEINTSVGRMAFEGRYLRGISEMPTRWADEGGYEALKAQAVAARSYALSYVGWRIGNQAAGGSICVTEACQVYRHSKADNPGRWADAVRETESEILVGRGSGEIVNSWYASTSGGYTFSYNTLGHTTPGLWDTPSGKDGWPDNSWEKKAGSPWFYKGWYRTRGGATCGRGNPWLTGEEMADILNAARVLYNGSGDVSRISPVTTSCFPGNPYSVSELQGIGGFSSVTNVSVVYGNDGSTQTVSFDTNKGNFSLSGEEFKKVFNLRAPGYIGAKSSLFNIVKL